MQIPYVDSIKWVCLSCIAQLHKFCTALGDGYLHIPLGAAGGSGGEGIILKYDSDSSIIHTYIGIYQRGTRKEESERDELPYISYVLAQYNNTYDVCFSGEKRALFAKARIDEGFCIVAMRAWFDRELKRPGGCPRWPATKSIMYCMYDM